MSNFKGTKGSWVISYKASSRMQINHGQIDIWYDLLGTPEVTKQVAEANALLISKAPEMLEMLESLENDNGAIPPMIWDKIQELIKQATET